MYLYPMQRGGTVYILSSASKTTLYVGVTSDLYKRIFEHRNKVYPDSFSAKYNCIMLVYYAGFDRIEEAIAEEKRIKGGSRKQKDLLINDMNTQWRDLWEDIKDW
jgi:putative endonuclease